MKKRNLVFCYKIKRVILFTILISFNHFCFGNDNSRLDDLSLEGLMQVSIATKTDRNLKDISSPVRIYTDKDIQQHGWLYLSEVLRDVPGVDIQDTQSGVFFAARGVADQSAHGNKTVIMIDGHNIGFPSTNSSNFLGLHDDINLASIKRIEILVGPGSTLHGANAFGLVVNLITYNPEDIDQSNVSLSVGSNEELVPTFTAVTKEGKWALLASGTYWQQNKSELAEVKISSTTGIENYDNDRFEDNFASNYAINAYADFDRQIRFGFHIMHNDSGHGSLFLSTDVGRHVFDKQVFYLDIDRKLSHQIEYKLQSHYLDAESQPKKIAQEFAGSSNSRGSANVGAKEIVLDNQLIYTPSNKSTWLAGLYINRSRQRPVSGSFVLGVDTPIPIPQARAIENWDNYALYLQWEWTPVNNFYSIAGIRFVDSLHQYSSTFLPQFGISYRFIESLALKFNYQTGYRPPSIFETGSTAAFLKQNPDLDSEHIETYSFSLLANPFQAHEFQATYYHTHASDLIKRTTTGEFIPGTSNPIYTDINVASMKIDGYEVDYKYYWNKRFLLKAAAGYTDSYDSHDDADTGMIVPYKLNVTVNWHVSSDWSFNIDNYWRIHPTTSSNNTVYSGKDAPDWLLANLTITKNRLFNLENLKGIIVVRNLFNDTYGQVDRRGGTSNIPGYSPQELRNYVLTLRYEQ